MDKSTKLDAPGAGLPKPELFIARRRFSFLCLRGNRKGFIEKFTAERNVIRQLLDSCPADQRSMPVLIRRLRGLEDSSRQWSVWMTLDHLRITNLAFASFIDQLTKGTIPGIKADTADVKPDPDVNSGIEKSFENSCDTLLAIAANAPDLRTKVRFPHPWFGPLDAYRWLALSAMHLTIHRRQIERILRGLHK